MLQKLNIQNYALIDSLEIDFSRGLNVITGETGAGKSILLGALSMILGERADKSVLLDKERKCVIEGVFETRNEDVKAFFKEHDLDPEKQVLLRREISHEGKSRSFVNDTPVTLAQLKALGELIVEIHSQHETLFLKQKKFQLSVVDAFAGTEKELEAYRNDYGRMKALQSRLSGLVEEEKKSKADEDYYRFLYEEIEEASLKEGEQEKLEEELQAATHAGEIRQSLEGASGVLSGGEENILQQLVRVQNQLAAASRHFPPLAGIGERLKSVLIELKDVSSEMDEQKDSISSDPRRLEAIHLRLDEIYRLEQKHRVKSGRELLNLRAEFETKLKNIASLDEEIANCRKEIADLNTTLLTAAQKISVKRTQAIPVIEKEIAGLLEAVSLPHARLKAEQEVLPAEKLGSDGLDSIRFLFSANKGIPLREIDKVASGGELSRLMLAIKASVAKMISLPVMIFDEIDTGISGETAMNVGQVLRRLSRHHQLIAITHLPQIASRGENHFFVYKETAKNKTTARVKQLSPDERIVQIAKMLSGEKPGASALENAKELLRS